MTSRSALGASLATIALLTSTSSTFNDDGKTNSQDYFDSITASFVGC